MATVTPSTGAAMRATRDARTSMERKNSSSWSSPSMPISVRKSTVPNTRRSTPGAPATSLILAMPLAVSMSGSTFTPGRRCFATSATSAALSALGRTTPVTPASPQRHRSCSNHCVCVALMRTMPAPPPARYASSSPLARSLSSSDTASSRSRMTASAPDALALAKRSGRLAGTKR